MTRDAPRALAPLAWTIYIALPVAGWGWLDGLPIGWLEAGAIALVWWAWASPESSRGAGDRRLPGMRALAVLTIAKLALGALLVSGGFVARYYANDNWSPPVERSVEFRRDDLTRLDRQIAFGGPGQPDLPLHFLNHLRFNFYRPEEPKRDSLAFSIDWRGFFNQADPPSERTFYLAGSEGIRGELLIDEITAVALDGGPDRTASVLLPPGSHALTIRVAAPYGSGRRIEAGEIVDGVRRPFDSRHVTIAPANPTYLPIGGFVRWLALLIDLGVLLWLAVLVVWRARDAWRYVHIGRLLWLAAIVEALLFALPYAQRVVILSGGDDWLMYEHLARAIIDDPLLRQPGMGAGQGAPFYFQPLYPYFVALTHLVFGDGVFGVVLVQRLLVPAAAGWAAAITRQLFGAKAGWVALIGGGLFLYVKVGRWSDVLLAEPLFTPLLVGWAWLLIQTAVDVPSWPRLLLTGAIGGVATLIRTTLFFAWPVVLPVWAASIRMSRARSTLIVVAMMMAVVGMLSLRTWIVTGAFALAPSSGGVALYVGNEPARPLAPAPSGRESAYDRLGLTSPTRAVAEYAFQRPQEFLGNLGRKALYSVGLFEISGIQPTGMGVPAVSLLYVGVWGAALIGAIRLMRSRARRDSGLVWLPALLAVSHFAMMIAFLPNVYGDRQILPMYPLLIPYASFAVEPVVRWAQDRTPLVAPVLLATLTLATFFPMSPRASDAVILSTLAAAILAISATTGAITPRHRWLYVGYASVFVALIFVQPPGDTELEMKRLLLLPLVAFGVGQLAGIGIAHRVTLGALAIGPFFTREAANRFAISHAADPFLWIVAGLMVLIFSLLTTGRVLTRRAATALASSCLVVALLLPFLPGGDSDVTDQLGDIRRGIAGVTSGDQQARDELTDDVRDVTRQMFEPFATGVAVVTGNGNLFSILCLAAVWMQIIVATRWKMPAKGSRSVLVSYTLLFGALLTAIAGSHVEVWDGSGYSLATLGILLGLTHARLTWPQLIDRPWGSGEDKVFL